MIKFKCLIHKETGTVIKYDEWKERVKQDDYVRFTYKGEGYFYDAKRILFKEQNDDFIIVYDSKFTTEELELANASVFECVRRDIIFKDTGDKLSSKIESIINKRYEFNSKYNTDL